MSTWWCERAWLPDGVADGVELTVEHGRFTGVRAGVPEESVSPTAHRLTGLALPGFADVHGHAFHRALRGRTHGGAGTFDSWRERMYAVAQVLDPELYLPLARAGYAELSLAGFTTVGEFHYLHHRPAGLPYQDPAAMATGLRQAAAEAGVRLTLLDTCYLRGGLDRAGYRPVTGAQRRFADADAAAWAARFGAQSDDERCLVGAAIHSVRAVPEQAMRQVAEAACAAGRPLHVHVSEQPAENAACLAHYGRSPVRVLDDAGVLGPATTAVHATHLEPGDLDLLGSSGATVCVCPSTEADLADGLAPTAALTEAGVPLAIGTDAHVHADAFTEARGLEWAARLGTGRRGVLAAGALLGCLTDAGQRALGWPDAGRLAIGARADLVSVRLDSTRTVGSAPEQVVFAAAAADVDTVLVDGYEVVQAGRHRLGDVAGLLAEAIERVDAAMAAGPGDAR